MCGEAELPCLGDIPMPGSCGSLCWFPVWFELRWFAVFFLRWYLAGNVAGLTIFSLARFGYPLRHSCHLWCINEQWKCRLACFDIRSWQYCLFSFTLCPHCTRRNRCTDVRYNIVDIFVKQIDVGLYILFGHNGPQTLLPRCSTCSV